MYRLFSNKRQRWRKVPKAELGKAELYLRAREKLCVSASARFLKTAESRGHIWYLGEANGEISALLLHSRNSLFPVFDKNPRIPGPLFLNRFLGKVQIHSVQGLKEDVELLELLMEAQGYFAAERIDYALMSLDNMAEQAVYKIGPEGLILREPEAKDEEELFALQSAYEQEEVLPKNAVFNAASCRYNLQRILSSEQVLVAEMNGRLVGKMNTSAHSFTRCQIGGVYVRPDCRGRGIAAKMTAVFAQKLLLMGKGISLFVKKRNEAALKVYKKSGFAVLADYRISYY